MDLQPGTYVARAVPESVSFGVSSNNHEQISIKFKIVEGDAIGTLVTWIGNFASGKATEITLETLATAGVNLDTENPLALEGLGSCDVSIVVEYRDRENGRVIPFVRYVNRASRSVFKKELDLAGVASLSDRIKATRAASKVARKGTTPAPAPAQATDEHGVPLGPDGRPIF